MRFAKTFAPLFALIILFATQIQAEESFATFIDGVKREALQHGVTQKTLDTYLTPLQAPPAIKQTPQVQHETHQPQKTLTFEQFYARLMPTRKLTYGRTQLQQNLPTLKRIESDFGVQPNIVISLWGIESDFGRYTGKYPLVQSLAYLAYANGRRAKHFRNELIATLRILNRPKVIPEQLKSAYDGGMGQPQFEPNTYIEYAVDYDNDGFKNIWTSTPDVLASIANFLQKNGWHAHEQWGYPVRLPANFPLAQATLDNKQPIETWQKLGITRQDGTPLPATPDTNAIILPDGPKGQAYLVSHNFVVLKRWNHALFVALSSGVFADRLKK